MARGMRAAARRMRALKSGTDSATAALHEAAAASTGAPGLKGDSKALFRSVPTGTGAFMSPRRLLAAVQAREGGGGGGGGSGGGGGGAGGSAAKRPARGTPK